MPRFTRLAVLAAACATAAAPASAAVSYPTRTIQIVIPYRAGGSTDLVFRIVAPRISKELGQNVVILNVPGGAGAIGIGQVAKAAPDGYTLGTATLSFVANKYYLKTKLPFDPERDLEAVSMVSRIPEVLTVNKNVPARSARDLVTLVKQKPGAINFYSAGVASDGELGADLFGYATGTKVTVIPFNSAGGGQAMISGQSQVEIAPIPSSLPFIASGDTIALGVTGSRPDPSLPNVPVLAATFPKMELYSFQGLVAPKGTPREIVDRIQAAVAKALADPQVKASLAHMGAEPVGNTPAQFDSYLKSQFALWSHLAAAYQSAGHE